METEKKIIAIMVLMICSTSVFAQITGDSVTDKQFDEYTKDVLGEKTEDIARQIRIYLDSHTEKSIEELQEDPEFKELAVQKVGENGYTCLYEARTGIMRFHPNEELINQDITYLKDKIPSWWSVFKRSLDGSKSRGVYNWVESDGSISEKYMVIMPAARTGNKTLMLATTTYLKDYGEEKESVARKVLRQKSRDVARQIEIYLRYNKEKTIKDLQNDERFKEIAVQKVGDTGYTSITDLDSGEIYFSAEEEVVGKSLQDMKDKIPKLYNFFIEDIKGRCSEGELTYNWPDEEGISREKYAYMACVGEKTADKKTIGVDASAFISEISKEETTKGGGHNEERYFRRKADLINSDVKKFLDHGVEDAIYLSNIDLEDTDSAKRKIADFYKENEKEIWFNVGSREHVIEKRKKIPVYKEITFIDKNGSEQIKINEDGFSKELLDVSKEGNTQFRSEDYFDEVMSKEEDIVNIGKVKTWYTFKEDLFKDVPKEDYDNYDKIIGRDTKKQGIMRFSKKVKKDDEVIGVIVLSMDYRILESITKHIDPAKDGLVVSTSYHDNYILFFDKDADTIVHPKPDNVRGYLKSGELAGYNKKNKTRPGQIFNLFKYDKSKAYQEIAEKTLIAHESYVTSATDVSGRTKLTLSYPVFYVNEKTNYDGSDVFGGIMMSVNVQEENEVEDGIGYIVEEKAKQIEKEMIGYMKKGSRKTLEELKKDKVFKDIVLQKIAGSGYTFLYDCNTMINHFHKKDEFRGMNMTRLKDEAFRQDWWEITKKTRGCESDSSGIYLWKDPDGNFRRKYKHTIIIDEKTKDGVQLALGVSIYLDEFGSQKKDGLGNINSKTNLGILLVMVGILITLFLLLLFLNKKEVVKLKRNYVLILICITTIIIMALFIFNTVKTTEKIIDSEQFHTKTVIGENLAQKKAHIKDYLANNIEKVRMITKRNELKEKLKKYLDNKDEEELRKIENEIDDIRDSHNLQEEVEIKILDTKGMVIASTKRKEMGDVVPGKHYFKSGLKVAKNHISKEDGLYKIFTSGPIVLEGEVIGVLVSEKSVNALEDILEIKTEKTVNRLVSIDREILTGERMGEIDSTLNTKECIQKHLIDGKKTHKNEYFYLEDTQDLEGREVILAHDFIQEEELCIISETNKEKNISYLRSVVREIWMFTGALLITLFIVAIIFYYLLTKSLYEEIEYKTREIRKINNELEKKIRDLKDSRLATLNMLEDVEEANKELERLDRAKSEFLNIVSHELKTPLTAIIAYLDILKDSESDLSKEDKESLKTIKRNTDSLKRLISNILEIARMESGKFELNKEKIDVNKTIEESVEDIEILAKRKGIKLRKKLKKVPKTMFDEERLKEVVNNLVSNAIKFTEKGEIKIGTMRKENNIVLTVSDTGSGIPKEHIKDLFKVFYQVDSSISRKYGGTGLGLAITKKIIEAHDAKIDVISKENEGTTFVIEIPIKKKT